MVFPFRPRWVLAVLAVSLVIGAALFASACGSDDLEEHRRNAIVEIGDVDLALRALEFDTAFKACEVAVRNRRLRRTGRRHRAREDTRGVRGLAA